MITRCFKNEYVEMWIEEGILHLIYSSKPLHLEAAKEIVHQRLELLAGRSMPHLADYTKGMAADKAARDYLANTEGVKGVSAGAIIIKNQIQKLLGNAYLTISRPTIPAKLFTEKKDALAWLSYYKNLN